MLVHGLRLLVALITFGVGVAASWLTSSGSHTRQQYLVEETAHVYVFQTRDAYPPPAVMGTRECKSGLKQPEFGEADVVEGGILNGKARSLPAAVYPPAAKSAGVEGTVYVRVTVDETGSVSDARSLGGPRMLGRAAEDAAREALFAPTRLSGRPVKVTGVLSYNFTLE